MLCAQGPHRSSKGSFKGEIGSYSRAVVSFFGSILDFGVDCKGIPLGLVMGPFELVGSALWAQIRAPVQGPIGKPLDWGGATEKRHLACIGMGF